MEIKLVDVSNYDVFYLHCSEIMRSRIRGEVVVGNCVFLELKQGELLPVTNVLLLVPTCGDSYPEFAL